MALEVCDDCGKSTVAALKACPYCGSTNRRPSPPTRPSLPEVSSAASRLWGGFAVISALAFLIKFETVGVLPAVLALMSALAVWPRFHQTVAPLVVPNGLKFAAAAGLFLIAFVAYGTRLPHDGGPAGVAYAPRSSRAIQDNAIPPPNMPSERGDLAKLTEFHRRLNLQHRALEAETDAFNPTYKAAVDAANMVALYEVAQKDEDVLVQLFSNIDKIEIPSFASTEVGTDAQAALNALRGQSAERLSFARQTKAMADSGLPKPSEVAALQGMADRANSAATMEALYILKAYQTLGIPADRIDVKNGGVLPATTNVKSAP